MSNEKQFRCSAEKEGGHSEAYLTWVHQADGFCYWRCDVCGWIKPDMKKLKSHNKDYSAALIATIENGVNENMPPAVIAGNIMRLNSQS